jgi:hypothetical protein
MDISEKGTAVCCFKNDRKAIVEYDLSRLLRSWQSEGEKVQLKCFKDNYIVIVTVEKKAERDNRGGEKYTVQIFDTLNIYFAHNELFNRVEFVTVGFDHIFLVTRDGKDERKLTKLTEKENAFKI